MAAQPVAPNLRQYLEHPELVEGWITPQAVVLKNGSMAYTQYFQTPGGGLILREALDAEHEQPHPESIAGLSARYDAGERFTPPSANNLDEMLQAMGWTEEYGIGLYANPEYGSIVVDTNAWDRNDPQSSAMIIPSINSSFDSFIGFISSYAELDKEIVDYIDSYKDILTKESVSGFGPRFADHVSKARFQNEAEYQFHSGSYNSPRSADSSRGEYSGTVVSHGDYHIVLDLGDNRTIDCNKVDLDRVPDIGESVHVKYDKGRATVGPTLPQSAAVYTDIHSEAFMKSKPTPWTHTGVTSEEITTEFGVGRIKHAVTVPEGTLCVNLEGGAGRWVVQDLAFLGDTNSMAYFDADHYGIDIPQNKITGILPAGVPRTEKTKPQLQVVGGEPAFDVWKDNYGRITALRATKPFVDDSDAPYGYSKHEIRVTAADGRAALAAYRAALLAPAKADATYYGTAICTADAESRLRRAGAEVSDYDRKAGCFYLRAPHDSVDLILDLQDDIKIDLRARDAADDVWLRDIATLPVEALFTERAFHQFWVHSDQNDGRLSTGSSAELDLRLDQIEAIDKRLKETTELSPVKNAAQPKPGNASPSPSPDM